MAFQREHTYQFPRYHLIHIAEWEYDAKHFIRTMRPNLWYYISASSHDILPINNDYLEDRRLLLDCVPTELRAALENLDSVPRMWRFLTRTFRFMTEEQRTAYLVHDGHPPFSVTQEVENAVHPWDSLFQGYQTLVEQQAYTIQCLINRDTSQMPQQENHSEQANHIMEFLRFLRRKLCICG